MKNSLFLYSIIISLSFSASTIGHIERIIDISISYNGKYYATASKEGKIIMWNDNHEAINSFTIDSIKSIRNISLSYDNKYLAIGSDNGTIDIMNLESNDIQSLDTKSNNKILLLKYINYKYLISCNDDDPIKVWDIHSYSTENNYDSHYSLFKEFLKPDDKIIDIKINTNHKNILASLDSDSFIRWDIGQEYHEKVSSHLPTTIVPSIESTKEFITLTDERIKNINPPSKSWWKFDPYKYYHFDISPDGSKIAIVTIDNNIIVWNANFTEYNTISIDSHDYRLNDIAFSSDGKYLASSSIDKTLKVWDLNNGKLYKTFEFSDDWGTKVSFINNTIICGTYKGDIIKYNIN